jgi:hypothetical protein
MIFGIFVMTVALLISAVAAYYSISGLTAIFAAAAVPIVIMGAALEAGKIVATLWLHKYWPRASIHFKLYLIPAIVVLMLITSMGIFGYLSKAHGDQGLVSGDALAKVAVYDERIQTAKDNIAAARKALQQLDAAVDQSLSRSTDERGADKAVAIRRTQQKERARLTEEIAQEQKTISQLNTERAPLAADLRKVEAEVGPIKYIAALIYGDSPDANLLERAVRWVIILLVFVFDPLALILILAAEQTIVWAREDRKKLVLEQPNTELSPALGPTAVESVIHCDDKPLPEPVDPAINLPHNVAETSPTATDEPSQQHDVSAAAAQVPLVYTAKVPQQSYLQMRPWSADEMLALNSYIGNVQLATATDVSHDSDPQVQDSDGEPQATTAVDVHEQLPDTKEPVLEEIPHADPPPLRGFQPPAMDETPLNPVPRPVQVSDQQINIPDLSITAEQDAAHVGFGIEFPEHAKRGDMFLRVDMYPSKLYKWNDTKWIEVNKESTDSYVYDDEYIRHLVDKILNGEYDVDMLSVAEQEQISRYLNERTNPQ